MPERFEELVEEVVARIRALLERGEIYAKHARLHAPGGIDPLPMPTGGGGGGGSGGHEIQEDGTALPQRAALNFGQGLLAQDNPQAGRTDVNVEYGGQGDVAPADAGPASAGTLLRLARADHKHSASVGTPVDLADSNQEGSATTLARSDHVHRRSVRVKSGTNNYVRNALDIIGLGVTDDALDDEIEIVHDASSPGHHAQFHDDSDHTSPSRVEVQDEGTAVAQRAVLNFVGDGVTVSDDAAGGRVNINIPGGGSTGGHEIQENGAALPQRSALNFAAGLVASDNQASDRTDVNLDYGAAADVSSVDASASAPGSLSRVARADHRHAASIGTPVDLGDANAEGTASTLARSDHVHKRSVRVKSGTSDFARNALNISGLGVADDAVNDEIDIVHDASSPGHHPQAHDHSSAADGSTLSPAVLNLPQSAAPAQTVEGQVVWDSTNDKLTVGDGTGRKVMAREDQAVMDGDAAGGELQGTYPNPTVATVHAGSAHHPQFHDDSDHTSPSRVEVQDEGTTVGTRAVLNFTGTGVRATDNAQAGRVDIEVPGSATIQLLLDGGGSPITAGLKAYVEVPFNCTVTGWTVVADQTGSILIDVWRSTYAGFPPTSANSIAGTEKPRLNAQQKNQDLSLTSWSTSLARGDWLAFNVDAASTVQLVTVSLRVERA